MGPDSPEEVRSINAQIMEGNSFRGGGAVSWVGTWGLGGDGEQLDTCMAKVFSPYDHSYGYKQEAKDGRPRHISCP